MSVQDGAIRLNSDQHDIDLRVSIVPTVDGETVVLRLLAEYVHALTLTDLGYLPEHQKILAAASQKPHGLILIAGPTGSGKTTTLYSLIKTLNGSELNITTIEDPVEYRIPGTNQIQVNHETHLTFAQGLRAIVRQDPDVILVGEIRDQETAEISVNAALTGHLVFSSFHANDAVTTIPRLIELGVEPFLLASTLEIVVAQRLVRKICAECKMSYVPDSVEIEQLGSFRTKYSAKNSSAVLYRGKGCSACHGLGYRGRTAVLEIIPSSPELKELILHHPSSNQLVALIRSQGIPSMYEDGIAKVVAGITTLDEIRRVIKE